MKLLNGQELASFIKERHAHQVRALRARKTFPKLAIVQVKDDPVINTYVRLKRQYGEDINVNVDVHSPSQENAPGLIEQLNKDDSVHGIIVQLPLADPAETERVVNLVAPDKDVDALGENPSFDPATPMAILWLLSGYNVELRGKKILLIGRGKLVGAPLEKILKTSGYDVRVIDRELPKVEFAATVETADIVITATGSPSIVESHMIKKGAAVVDAGVASEEGKTVGDLAPDVYERDDLTLTPQKGGVGPLTVCALFENVLRSAERKANAKN